MDSSGQAAQPITTPAGPEARSFPPMGNAVPLPGAAPTPEQSTQQVWGSAALGPDAAVTTQIVPGMATGEVAPSITPDPHAVAPDIQGITTPTPAEQAAKFQAAMGGVNTAANLGPDVAAAIPPIPNAPLTDLHGQTLGAQSTTPVPVSASSPAETFAGMPSAEPKLPDLSALTSAPTGLPSTDGAISTMPPTPPPAEPIPGASEPAIQTVEASPTTGNPELDKLMKEMAGALGAEIVPVEDVITRGEAALNRLSPNSPLAEDYRAGFRGAVTFSLTHKNKD